jgi:DNA replication protein DnaC
MGIPVRFHGKFVSNFTGSKAEVDRAVAAITSNRSVFLYGICGTGKTHLAVGLMMEYLRAGNFGLTEYERMKFTVAENTTSGDGARWLLPYFLPSVELFFELKSTFDRKDRTEAQVLDKYSECPLLLIDDIGTEKISDWSRQIFYTLIDRRYRNMRQTIITTNKTPDEIAATIDDRITSRIFEMGEVIEIKGNDKRIE